jgi:hypothetical protein
MADFVRLGGSGPLPLKAHRRWPLARIVLHCAACSWARDYAPEAIVRRLQALGAGGYRTDVGEVARRVAWPCPACGRLRWTTWLAYPKATEARDIARATRAIRS